MSPDTERWIELATDLGHKLNTAVKDVIPPEAQVHLLNAQRELLTALFLIYEHQSGRRPAAPAPRRRAPRARTTTTRQKIEID